MQAAAKNGIKRFVMLSALFSREPTRWRQLVLIYLASLGFLHRQY